ncbi:Peptidoglycan-binding domain 1 [Trichormus variabilis ATCC 29413]|uniref:Peptidoglycan-binding domain 1 n=1 Tax=Trichormus variabilis (strain ATCC 29413 / PCC 7937) TaxID=240292 RepID=Q3MBZ1_TRIV2|nr:peptidoglycan-binding protein [Trichormus variabilis]ABA21495.1 Peptidoglycan-binding domain 1 [Trichormus variabilis ATCC 29413]QHD80940.1 peptidoglycan-binding protein [Trichormus variabilis 0441]
MWCGFGKSSAIVATACVISTSFVISNTTFAARQRNYTPQEFRTVLRGLGYNVKVTNTPLTDAETKKAISEFQKGYKLTPVDGIAGPKTQDFAANIVQILQANLNAVLKTNPPLPRDQFYGPKTEAAIKEFQTKHKLEATGIANLALRQKLDEEAKKVISQPSTEPTAKPSPSPTSKPTTSPTAKPSPSPTSKPTTSPTAKPSPSPTSKPTTSPTAKPSPSPTSKPTTSPTSKPTVSPSPTASPATTPTTSPSPTASPTTTP